MIQESLSSKDVIDVKLEMLLRQWHKSADILFTIHPVDGSLITWSVAAFSRDFGHQGISGRSFVRSQHTCRTVEWLDDVHRQPRVAFSSRLPGAFPLTDAASLHSG